MLDHSAQRSILARQLRLGGRSDFMTFRRRVSIAAATLGLVTVLGATQAKADSRGTFYALHMKPQEDVSSDDTGLGVGATVAIPFANQETFKLAAGFDFGNLESSFSGGTLPGTVASTTQDYVRLFGGIEIGRRLDARIRPHLGLNAALLLQNRTTKLLDGFGESYDTRTDSSTRLAYDISAGLDIGITSKTGLDAGVRFMNGFKVTLPDGLQTVQQDYLQFYVGVTHRFAWPN